MNVNTFDHVTFCCDVPNPATNRDYTVEVRGWYADNVNNTDCFQLLCCDKIYLKENVDDAIGVGMDINCFVNGIESDRMSLFETLWSRHIVKNLPSLLEQLNMLDEDVDYNDDEKIDNEEHVDDHPDSDNHDDENTDDNTSESDTPIQ